MRHWWAKFWRRIAYRWQIWYVLEGDQCWLGFDHTQGEVLSWLSRCTPEAQEQFYATLSEMIEEARTIQK